MVGLKSQPGSRPKAALRDVACALLLAAVVAGAAHILDRVAYGLEMAERGLASHQQGGNP